MWGQGHFCVFPEDAEYPVWVPSQFVKPHGSPGPEDEEAEPERLALGQEAAKADSSPDQRVVKEMANDKTDTGQ
jgi:hypothetical protein